MFTAAFNFLKNLFARWFASRAKPSASRNENNASNALSVVEDKPTRYNPYKTNSANQNQGDLPGTIRVGMTTAQLVQSLGPALTKHYDGNREIWTYLGLKMAGVRTHIAIQDGVVVTWQDVRPNAAPRFAAQSP